MALSPDERSEIETWVEDSHPYMMRDIDELFDWIGDDFDKFERYAEIMDDLHEAYLEGRDLTEYLDELDDLDLPDDEKWSFYH